MSQDIMTSDIEITVLPPPLFNYDADDLLGEWKQWLQKLEEYLVAYDQADSPDEDKIRVLLNHLGNEGKEIFESLEAKDCPGERITSFEELTEALATYFDSAKNVLFERFKFFKMKRKSGQPVIEFVSDLTKAASCCEFTEKENIVRDKLLEQLKDKSLIERLLVEGGSLTLERAVKICHKWEIRKALANENKPPGTGNDPEPPQPSANNLTRRKRDANPTKNHSGSLPVITILGVVPKEELHTASVQTTERSDDDRDFWDDGDSRTYSEEDSKPARDLHIEEFIQVDCDVPCWFSPDEEIVHEVKGGPEGEEATESEGDPIGPQGSMCDICGRICQGPAALRYHMEVHSGKKPYACTKCDYRGTLQASLQSHMRVHGGFKFKCDQCGFKARRSYGLKMHKRINHTGERPFTCEFCDKSYPDRGALNYHVRTRHTEPADEKKPRRDPTQWNYTCETCGRKFVMKDRYEAHLAGHETGEPYHCYACDFKTISRNSIVRHLTNRHGEKKYSCTQCDYKTAMKSDYKDHLPVHSGTRSFMCDVCGFRAASRSTLTSHKRVHNEKSISCEFCDFKTNRRQSMKGHKRRHTGERPYECSFCGYKAAQRGTLTKHIEVIHNNNKESSKKSKAASKTASNADSCQSVGSSQKNSQELCPPQNNASVNTNYSHSHIQHQNYNSPHVLPATPTVYLAQNNYYPSTYYNSNTNVEIVHNNSPFDLDQFVRSNMIN